MAENTRKEVFITKYQDREKIWSGDSFLNYLDLQALLTELPVSAVAEASKAYAQSSSFIIDFALGEILHSLTRFEGTLKDRDAQIHECIIRPIIRPNNIIIEFKLKYQVKEEEKEKSWELIRDSERSFIFFYD